ncbi:MAG: hypothetical protein JXA14_01890 [Anaerolineae bacterium]|jgi:hypothetical protein|nr:hypothetical protein [Anaerolineae bacterium]
MDILPPDMLEWKFLPLTTNLWRFCYSAFPVASGSKQRRTHPTDEVRRLHIAQPVVGYVVHRFTRALSTTIATRVILAHFPGGSKWAAPQQGTS